jgi:hypothetical protein
MKERQPTYSTIREGYLPSFRFLGQPQRERPTRGDVGSPSQRRLVRGAGSQRDRGPLEGLVDLGLAPALAAV